MLRVRKIFLISMFLFLLVLQVVSAQQKKTVTGTISDTSGESLIGVSVSVKNVSGVATVTDVDGKYSLSVPADATTLIVSYVGMKTQEVAIKGPTVDIVMEGDHSELDEVVVIGYGTMKKRDLTGPISSVGEKSLRDIPVTTAAEAITGKLAGVQVVTTEGSPDAEINIRVRGGGSITQSNQPLFIVDGFPVSTISDIPPTDIESIDVLKDASSAAIYGSRGANGVIIITTKSGKEGKISVSYNAYVGFKKIAKTLDVLSVKDYLNWQYEYAMLKNQGDPASYEKYFGAYQDMDMYDGVSGNDWQEQVYGRNGNVFNQSLGISGGSDKMKFNFNYARIDDKAIMEGSDYMRNNLSMKLNYQPIKTVTIDFSARYSEIKVNGGGMNEQNEVSASDSRLKHSVIYTPLPIKSLNSEEAGDEEESAGDLVNPLTAVADNDQLQKRKALNMAGSVSWEVFNNFKIKTEIGYDYFDNERDRFYGKSTYYVKNKPAQADQGKPALQLEDKKSTKLRNTNTISYDFKKLIDNKDHNINVLLGHEIIATKSKTLTNVLHGFPSDFTFGQARTLSTQGVAYSTNNYFNPDDRLVSFFGRANYDYQGKYLLAVTFRADGSTKFGENNKWGYFPSVAGAWRISSEKFMDATKSWLEDLKLRASYGAAGNNNIPSGYDRAYYVSNTTAWVSGINNYWTPSKVMPNPDLKWETTYTRNVGFDYTLMSGKLSGSFEFYLNNTKDLLLEAEVGGTGYDTQYRNMGETQNKGLEMQLNYVAIDKKNFGLNLGFNLGFNKNKIKDLGDRADWYAPSGWASTEISTDYFVGRGHPLGIMYGYVSDGRYEVSDFAGYNESTKKWILKEGVADASGIVGDLRPGSMKLKNLSGEDNKITDDDRTIIGDANPDCTGGFTLNGRLYGFDLTAAFNFSIGNDVYNANKIEYTSSGKYQYRNMIDIMASGKRWTNLTPDGQISNDPAVLNELNKNTTMWSPYMKQSLFTDWAVEDASFLRLNTLTLGYTLPTSITKKAGIQSLRFYASAYNVFCWTNYSGFDPEVSTRRKTGLTPGVDYSAYPKSRQFLFGLNLNF